MKTLKQKHVVTANETADVLGSGNLPVFGTPALVSFMEKVCKDCLESYMDPEEGNDSVGMNINVQHLRPSKVGEVLTASVYEMEKDGRAVSFNVEVHNEAGNVVGTAIHTRYIIDSERFMAQFE